MRLAIGVSFLCVTYLAFFYPVISFKPSFDPLVAQQDTSFKLKKIQAKVSEHVSIQAEKCIYSDNQIVFYNVRIDDEVSGFFEAQKVTWLLGSELFQCDEMINGYMNEQELSVQSPQATYNFQSGEMIWGDHTLWTIG